jgi:hypothetical protein
MDHIKILSRAWTITWRNKALWLFGFLLVLAGGAGARGNANPGAGGSGYQFNGSDIPRIGGAVPNIDWGVVLTIFLIAIAVAVLLAVIMVILRYVVETSLIAGVDEIESTEAALTVRRGFRLGWSRGALRLFLIDLIIGLPLVVVFIVLFLLAASPFLLWAVQAPGYIHALATVIGIGLVLLVGLLLIAVAIFISLIMPYIQRCAVLGKQGVLDSIRQGFQLVRASFLDTGLMYLLLAGIRFVWGLLMIPVAILIVGLATLIGLFVGGVPGLLTFALAHSEIAAAVVGAPLFLIVFVLGILLLTAVAGVFEVYVSSAWTLTYREVVARRQAAPPALPQSA